MIEFLLALTLYWDAPTEREDGTPLPASEISYYEVYHNDASLGTTPTLSLDVDAKGDYKVRTVDTDGQRSVFSNTVTVKGNPNAPGQMRRRQ